MSRYNLKSLSPQDFQELARDLLQAEWNISLEAFKPGKDDGIDLRHISVYGGTTIIQCKHYVGSSYSKLLSDLKAIELPKIFLLHPQRYILFTSIALSPANKRRISEALSPYIIQENDIIGADDIDSLLQRHPIVERANFKLWLSSTEVIERILHNAEHCQATFQVERIRQRIPLFVQVSSFPAARKILNEERILIISGAPGIGKTTLAEMLMFAALEEGYEPVIIQSEISEGKKLFRAERKQVFYYDDFLGQTFLGDTRDFFWRNNDQALNLFIEQVQSTDHSKFILTTREHILKQATQISERLSHKGTFEKRFVLELAHYSFGQKARILYNHLFFSNLSQSHKEAILVEDFFFDVIRHPNYNPRLIEWIATRDRIKTIDADNYRSHILRLLDSPEAIWKHAFQHQISHSSRTLLLCIYSLGEYSTARQIEEVFEVTHREITFKYNRSRDESDCKTSLQELEGSFLTYIFGFVQFLNPSVKDFIASLILASRQTQSDLITSMTRFMQVENIFKLISNRDGDSNFNYRATCELLFSKAELLAFGPSVVVDAVGAEYSGRIVDSLLEPRLVVLIDIAEELKTEESLLLCSRYLDHLITWWRTNPFDFGYAISSLNRLLDSKWVSRSNPNLYSTLLSKFYERLRTANADDWLRIIPFARVEDSNNCIDQAVIDRELEEYRENGAREERQNCSNSSELSELKESLVLLEENFSILFPGEIGRIEEEIAQKEEWEPRSPSGALPDPPTSHELEVMSENEVRQMFMSLKSK